MVKAVPGDWREKEREREREVFFDNQERERGVWLLTSY
jgi:hypothetical protein